MPCHDVGMNNERPLIDRSYNENSLERKRYKTSPWQEAARQVACGKAKRSQVTGWCSIPFILIGFLERSVCPGWRFVNFGSISNGFLRRPADVLAKLPSKLGFLPSRVRFFPAEWVFYPVESILLGVWMKYRGRLAFLRHFLTRLGFLSYQESIYFFLPELVFPYQSSFFFEVFGWNSIIIFNAVQYVNITRY